MEKKRTGSNMIKKNKKIEIPKMKPKKAKDLKMKTSKIILSKTNKTAKDSKLGMNKTRSFKITMPKIKMPKISKKVVKIISKTIKIIALMILVLSLVLCIIYNIVNYNIYNKITKSKDETISINYKFGYIVFWDKTIKVIKSSNKKINISTKNFDVNLNSKDIGKYLNLNDLKFKSEIFEYENIKGLKGISLDISKIKNLNSISNVIFSPFIELKTNKNIDIYYENNDNKLILYKNSIDTSVEKINLEILRNDKNEIATKYIFVYVPVQDITCSAPLELNRTISKKIDLKVVPDNATNKNIKYSCEDKESLEISADATFTGKKAGDFKITASIDNENISKVFDLKVNEVVNKINTDKKSISIFVGETANLVATVEPDNAINKEIEYITTNDKIATVEQNGKIIAKEFGKCEIEIKTKSEPIISVKIPVTIKKKFSSQNSVATYTADTSKVIGVTYIQGILIANKKYALPSTYNPGINGSAMQAFNSMKAAAASSGFNLKIASGFRSYTTQEQLYNNYVRIYGQASADTFSARPGHSEHQTGLAFDIGSVNDNYGNTPEGQWLANNCMKYGFILRYPKGKQGITGYKYEPWHFRYLGTGIATSVHNSGLCLEEYLKI